MSTVEHVPEQTAPTSLPHPRVSVVIPCLNEAENIEECVTRAITAMNGAGIDGEVVVCDNNSTDGSGAIAKEAGARVVAVSRLGMDKTHSRGRDATPFVIRVEHEDGEVRDYRAAAVIDASGTWSTRNPLGTSGVPAPGEADAAASIASPLPDVLGRERETFGGRTAVVVGAGHSAANTLINLSELAAQVPGTKILWAIRGSSAAKVYGGGDAE